MMLIIGLNGSPQKEGNTLELLKASLEPSLNAGAEISIIHAGDALKGVSPFCTSCSSPCGGHCFKGKELEKVFEVISQADGIIIGSPVYFGTVSGQLKAFWDKTRILRGNKTLVNVVGGALAVGASRFGGQETTIKAIHDMMLVQGMTVVGDGNAEADAGHQGGCAQRPSCEDETGLLRARILGQRVLEVAQATKVLRKR